MYIFLIVHMYVYLNAVLIEDFYMSLSKVMVRYCHMYFAEMIWMQHPSLGDIQVRVNYHEIQDIQQMVKHGEIKQK